MECIHNSSFTKSDIFGSSNWSGESSRNSSSDALHSSSGITSSFPEQTGTNVLLVEVVWSSLNRALSGALSLTLGLTGRYLKGEKLVSSLPCSWSKLLFVLALNCGGSMSPSSKLLFVLPSNCGGSMSPSSHSSTELEAMTVELKMLLSSVSPLEAIALDAMASMSSSEAIEVGLKGKEDHCR